MVIFVLAFLSLFSTWAKEVKAKMVRPGNATQTDHRLTESLCISKVINQFIFQLFTYTLTLTVFNANFILLSIVHNHPFTLFSL